MIMNIKLLNGILIGLAVVIMIFSAFPLGMIIALAFWIYLAVMIRKEKRASNDKMEPELAKKYLKRLKAFLVVGGISFPIAIAGIIMHNAGSSLPDTEESSYFRIGIIALYVFMIASAGGMVIFLKGKKKIV